MGDKQNAHPESRDKSGLSAEVYSCLRRLEKKYEFSFSSTESFMLPRLSYSLLRDVQQLQRYVLPYTHLSHLIARESGADTVASVQLMERVLALISRLRVCWKELYSTSLHSDSLPSLSLVKQQLDLQEEVILFRKRFLALHAKISRDVHLLDDQVHQEGMLVPYFSKNSFSTLCRSFRMLFILVTRIRHSSRPCAWLSQEIASLVLLELTKGQGCLKKWIRMTQEALVSEREEAHAQMAAMSSLDTKNLAGGSRMIENLLRLDTIESEIDLFGKMLDAEYQSFLEMIEKERNSTNPRFQTVLHGYVSLCHVIEDARDFAIGIGYLLGRQRETLARRRSKWLQQIVATYPTKRALADGFERVVEHSQIELKRLLEKDRHQSSRHQILQTLLLVKRQLLPLFYLDHYAEQAALAPEASGPVHRLCGKTQFLLQTVELLVQNNTQFPAMSGYDFFAYFMPQLCLIIRRERPLLTKRMQNRAVLGQTMVQLSQVKRSIQEMHEKYQPLLTDFFRAVPEFSGKFSGPKTLIPSEALDYASRIVEQATRLQETIHTPHLIQSELADLCSTLQKVERGVDVHIQQVGLDLSSEFIEAKEQAVEAQNRLAKAACSAEYRCVRDTCLVVGYLDRLLARQLVIIQETLPSLIQCIEEFVSHLGASRPIGHIQQVVQTYRGLLESARSVVRRIKTFEGYLQILKKEMEKFEQENPSI